MQSMAEGVADSSGNIRDTGVSESRPPEPPADPVMAPKGWTWDRKTRDWVPRKRAAPTSSGGAEPGAAPNPAYRDAEDERHLQQLADEFNAQVEAGDPDPGWFRDEQQPGDDEPLFEVDAAGRRDIHALIALFYTVPAELLVVADPYCFEPLGTKKTTDDITAAVTDIVCASPRIAAWAASASGLMPWLKLAVALKPVGLAALHHHILRDVEVKVDREKKEMEITERDWSKFPAA